MTFRFGDMIFATPVGRAWDSWSGCAFFCCSKSVVGAIYRSNNGLLIVCGRASQMRVLKNKKMVHLSHALACVYRGQKRCAEIGGPLTTVFPLSRGPCKGGYTYLMYLLFRNGFESHIFLPLCVDSSLTAAVGSRARTRILQQYTYG